MKKKILKTVTPTLLAVSMVVNSAGVNVLAATGTASDPTLKEKTSEDNEAVPASVSEETDSETSSNARRSTSGSNIQVGKDLSLADAVKSANSGDTITLTDDITLTEKVDITKDITLDFDSHTITVNITGSSVGARGIGVAYADVTMVNGTLTSSVAGVNDMLVLVTQGSLRTESMNFKTNNGSAIALYEFSGEQDASVTISSDSTVTSESGEGITAYGKESHHTIEVEGTVTANGTHPAICGSYENLGGTDINIRSGAKINGQILQMSPGDVLIEDDASVINSKSGSAVSITKGSLTVKEGAVVKATSSFESYQPSADGHVYDGGSAIFVEPAGDVSVTIEGGTITSTNGSALYAPKAENADLTLDVQGGTFEGNTAEEKGAVNVNGLEKFISGGTYNTDVGQYVGDNQVEVKVTHSRKTSYCIGDDAMEKMSELVSGDMIEFKKLGEEKEFKLPAGVNATNNTGEDIKVNGTDLSNNHVMTAIDENASLSLSVMPEVTNHLGDFDETLETDYGWTSMLGYVEPGADIDYTITIGNEKNYAAPKNLVVKAQIPAGTTLTSADDTYEEEDGYVVWKDVSVEAGKEKTLSFKVKVDNPASEIYYSTVVSLTCDNNKDGALSSDGEEVSTLMYGIVYDLNGGRAKTGEETVTSGMLQLDHDDYRIEGTTIYVNLTEDAEAGRMDIPRTQADWSKVCFAGWSMTKHPGFVDKKPADMVETLELTGHTKIYAVWAKDENDNQIPDFEPASNIEELRSAAASAAELAGKEADYEDDANWTEFETKKAAVDMLLADEGNLTENRESEIAQAITDLDAAKGKLKRLNFTNLLLTTLGMVGDQIMQDDYTMDSWQPFSEYLNTALEMTGGNHSLANRSQEVIDTLKDNLQRTYDGLKKRADFTALDDAIKAAKEKTEGKTEANFDGDYAGFEKALAEAEALAAQYPQDSRPNAESTPELEDSIRTLSEALTLATAQITEKKAQEPGDANFDVLDSLIREAESVDTGLYTDTTGFEAALSAAKDLKKDSSLTEQDQGRIDACVEALKNAMDALTLKNADYGALDKAIEAVSALEKENYTEESYKALSEALDAARALDRNLSILDQAVIDNALAALESAADVLVPATPDTPIPPEVTKKTITVTVLDDNGDGVKDASVFFETEGLSKLYKTDSTGKIVVDDLDYGTYKVTFAAVPSGYTFEKTELTIEFTDKEDIQIPTFTVKKVKAPTPTHSGGSSSSSGGGSSSSGSSSSGSSSSKAAGPANTWIYDAARDKWTYDNNNYKNRWAYIFNPYAVQGQGQEDWFFFDGNGEMITGWFTDADGLTYYLNETSDGTRGRMVTGWNWIADASGKKRCYYFSEVSDGTRGHLFKGPITPDGYAVDTTGAWVVDGKVVER